jgi:hypothetical protein
MTIDGTGEHVSGGVIAGVISVSDFNAALRQARGAISSSLCNSLNGPTFDGDMMVTESQDPGQRCDGISIGVAFTARRVTLGPTAAPVTPTPPPCAPP